MPLRRDKDTGETVEVPSELVKPGKQGSMRAGPSDGSTDPRERSSDHGKHAPVHGQPRSEAPTVPIHRSEGRPHGSKHVPGSATRAGNPGAASLEDPPVAVRSGSAMVNAPFGEAGDEPTRPLRRRAKAEMSPGPAGGDIDEPMDDPVVGWLVVTAGPGKGKVLQLGYGVNSLGRGVEARARLDFGDDQISRQTHATVTYDPRGRQFYLQHGGGRNLTYLEDQPVLVPTEIEPMQEFSVGTTMLRFVPLCGPEFDWQDTEDG